MDDSDENAVRRKRYEEKRRYGKQPRNYLGYTVNLFAVHLGTNAWNYQDGEVCTVRLVKELLQC